MSHDVTDLFRHVLLDFAFTVALHDGPEAARRYNRIGMLLRPHAIWNTPITKITAALAKDAIEQTALGAAVGSKVLELMQRVGEHAITTGLVDSSPLTSLQASPAILKWSVLGVASRRPEAAIVDPLFLATYLRQVEHSQAPWRFKAGTELLARSLQRPEEVVRARWEHIDLERAVWSIPLAETMRSGRSGAVRVVPLCVELVRMLRLLDRRSEWVFHNWDLARHALPKAMGRRLEMRLKWRNAFFTWATAPSSDGSAPRLDRIRTEVLLGRRDPPPGQEVDPKVREAMQAWSDFLTAAPRGPLH